MRLLPALLGRRVLLAAPVAAIGPSPVAAPRPCPTADDGDTALALSELQGQLARTQAGCLRLAQQLEARYQRYSWTEQLAQDLRAIAHDTPPSVGG